MAENVVMTSHSWKVDDEGVFVALPMLCADCVVKSTYFAFAEYDPFQRGLLTFLLADVREVEHLASLLGITDPAFIELMADQLEQDGLLRRTRPTALAPTTTAIEMYRKPGQSQVSKFGKLFYRHDGQRGYVVSGPLSQDAREEPLGPTEELMADVSVGTPGSPFVARCIAPDLPSSPPQPMLREHAASGARQFAQRARRSSVIDAASLDSATLTLQNPRWERLLVKVSLSEKNSTERDGDEAGRRKPLAHSTVTWLADQLVSPHANEQLRAVLGTDRSLEAMLRRILRDRPPKDSATLQRAARLSQSAPRDATPPGNDPVVAGDTVRAGVIDMSLGSLLCSTLGERLFLLDSQRHIPVTTERDKTTGRLVDRFAYLGFETGKGSETAPIFPIIADEELDIARRGNWRENTHLWLAFVAWAFCEEEGVVRPLSALIENLPSIVADAHWGNVDGSTAELRLVIEHIESAREVQL